MPITSTLRRLVSGLSGRQPAASSVASSPAEYLRSYAARTDERVAADPQEAIGGRWEEIGALQFDFLRREGLSPGHRMLDIGCGTLRGGRHFIAYLEPGHYTGIDISAACIETGRRLVAAEGLEAKRPRLLLNDAVRMDFAQVAGETFDILLAQSVFTHLPEPVIDECLAHVGRCMAPGARFYFTYKAADRPTQTTDKDFAYPWSFLADLARRHGFEPADLSDRYPHPRGQRMARIT